MVGKTKYELSKEINSLKLENDTLKETIKQLEINIDALIKELKDEKFIYGVRGD